MLNSPTLVAKARHADSGHLRFDTTPSWSPRIFAAGLRCIDIACALLASAAVGGVFMRFLPSGLSVYPQFGLAALLACETLWLVGGVSFQDLGTLGGRERHVAAAVLVGTAMMAACMALQLPSALSVAWLSLAWGATTMAMLLTARLSSGHFLQAARASGRLVNKVAVLGDGAPAQALMQRLLKEDPALIRLIGCYRVEPERRAKRRETGRDGGPGVRGDISTLMLDCRLGGIDSIVMACPPADDEARWRLESLLANYAVDLYMLPGDIALAPATAQPAVLGQQAMLLTSERPLKDWKGVTKNIFDRVAAFAILLAVLPLLTVVAIMIRVGSPGPVLFRQLRVGFNNDTFHILKFRTMYVQATDRLATVQTSRNDPRVTRLGRMLRKLSIDELPQLFNVLQGTMSLVGPRPHAPGTAAGGERVEFLVDGYARRHLVKPGITGLAQVRGLRGGMTTQQQVADRVRCDLEYIRRQSIGFDLKIILGTVMREFNSRHAC